jgi:proteasome accessory factor A
VARSVPFDRLMQHLVPFFVTRQIYAGSGKVGAENKGAAANYQLSQRADFFETLVDLNTMVKRPIFNTRDEPHADASKYRRLHVIVGDANMAEYSTYLKIGATAAVLTLIEEEFRLPTLELADPVAAIKDVSRDLQVNRKLRLADGRQFTAVEIQRAYLEAAQNFYATRELDTVTKDVLVQWERILDQLAADPMQLATEIDWIIKLELLQSYMSRKGCDWKDPRIAMMDLQYHDIRLEKGLYYSLERDGFVKRLVTDAEVDRAEQTPPSDTRAYFRGMCLKKFPKEVYASSWSSILFDVGNTSIKKVPLLEPLRGTEAMVRPLLENSNSVQELLAQLTG